MFIRKTFGRYVVISVFATILHCSISQAAGSQELDIMNTGDAKYDFCSSYSRVTKIVPTLKLANYGLNWNSRAQAPLLLVPRKAIDAVADIRVKKRQSPNEYRNGVFLVDTVSGDLFFSTSSAWKSRIDDIIERAGQLALIDTEIKQVLHVAYVKTGNSLGARTEVKGLLKRYSCNPSPVDQYDVSEFVGRDYLQGPTLNQREKLFRLAANKFGASGGQTSLERLAQITSMAAYSGYFDYPEMILSELNAAAERWKLIDIAPNCEKPVQFAAYVCSEELTIKDAYSIKKSLETPADLTRAGVTEVVVGAVLGAGLTLATSVIKDYLVDKPEADRQNLRTNAQGALTRLEERETQIADLSDKRAQCHRNSLCLQATDRAYKTAVMQRDRALSDLAKYHESDLDIEIPKSINSDSSGTQGGSHHPRGNSSSGTGSSAPSPPPPHYDYRDIPHVNDGFGQTGSSNTDGSKQGGGAHVDIDNDGMTIKILPKLNAPPYTLPNDYAGMHEFEQNQWPKILRTETKKTNACFAKIGNKQTDMPYRVVHGCDFEGLSLAISQFLSGGEYPANQDPWDQHEEKLRHRVEVARSSGFITCDYSAGRSNSRACRDQLDAAAEKHGFAEGLNEYTALIANLTVEQNQYLQEIQNYSLYIKNNAKDIRRHFPDMQHVFSNFGNPPASTSPNDPVAPTEIDNFANAPFHPTGFEPDNFYRYLFATELSAFPN